MANLKLNSTIKYENGNDGYYVQMKRRHFPWWLLLLLPLLLLIQCEKDICVTLTDCETGEIICSQDVLLEYQAHLIFKDGGFRLSDSLSIVNQTDETGTACFSKLPCSLFSYIFYCLSDCDIIAGGGCYEIDSLKTNFHYTDHVDMCLNPKYVDAKIKIYDAELGYVLPDGELRYEYQEPNGDIRSETLKADADGMVTIPHVRYCSDVKLLHASCDGYADTSKTDMPCADLLNPDSENSAMRLHPLKARFTFFVFDKETKKPIPYAEAVVTLKNPDGSTETRTVHTSTDGRGIAVYDKDAFVLAVIAIHATKPYYKDGDLEGGPFTVRDFIPQPDPVRTVWLVPDPFTIVFKNIDCHTKKPIQGVTNTIKITDPAGNVTIITRTSDAKGVFPITAKEGSKIEITAEKKPYYQTTQYTVPSFKNKTEVIELCPEMVTVHFRTVDAASWALLPGCTLKITGSISGSLMPKNSGGGSFDVTFRRDERITIIAEKSGYKGNYDKVKNNTYDELALSPDQKRRDIPLKTPPPPSKYPTQECNGGGSVLKPTASDVKYSVETYIMDMPSGIVKLSYDFMSVPDAIQIYDGTDIVGKPIYDSNGFVSGTNTVSVNFTKGAITVVLTSNKTQSTAWSYEVHCP